MNEFEIVVLKDEDRLAPPDPQATGIDLMAALRAVNDEAWRLCNLLAGEDAGTPMGRRRAQTRSIELREQAALALDMGEALLRALRAHGALSTPRTAR